MTKNELQDAACAIVNSRELCGNEREALRDWEDDNRRLSATERGEVWSEAETIWSGYQREAGVAAPISREERASITRMMERAP